jgi:SAM-dependent methyltransferase
MSLYDYDKSGSGYSRYRKADPEIEKLIHSSLGDAKTVLNAGAGTGSYEPHDRYVIPVEPSETMRRQRPTGSAPVLNCLAEELPFDDNSFDASMAVLTIHHWPNILRGIQEIRRVAKGPVVIVTFDMDNASEYWLYNYAPGIVEADKKRFPSINFILNALGGKSEVSQIPVPADCKDFFQEGLYARPEAFLVDEIRKTQSGWSFLPAGEEQKAVQKLKKELESGEWDKKYGHFRTMPHLLCALRLIVNFK